MTGTPSYAHDPARWRGGRHVLAGGLLALALIGGGGYWSVAAELEGAIVAHGELRVETTSKPVQHPTGGIVGAILVKDGDRVTAGQPLLSLDRTTEEASLAIVDGQLLDHLAHRERLLAERDGRETLIFPDAVRQEAARNPDRTEALEGQRALFASRRAVYRQQREQMTRRIAQLVQETRASRARRQALDVQLGSLDADLATQRDLLARHLGTRQRVERLVRERARIAGEREALWANEERLRDRIEESRIETARLAESRREEALSGLREVETRLAQLRQQKIVAGDALRRVDLRAPVDGIVQDMRVFAPGAVVGPGEALLTVVPVSDRLILEAKVPAAKRDRIAPAQPTRVRFTVFDRGSTPELYGEIVSIAADRSIAEGSGMSYYSVKILVPEDERARLGVENTLVPGMPADIYILTEARSPLTYLLKPLIDNFEPAFKE